MKRIAAVLALIVVAVPAAVATSIRTTSPGTIVFRGGAVVPRYFYIRETAGPFHFTRNRFLLYAAYSPTPRTLLEIEAPFDRVSSRSIDYTSAGNATVWAKYRFYRVTEEWGDRHAAVRVGLALPTGVSQNLSSLLGAVAAQLQPSAGAWSPALDLTYGQAIRRFIYHLNLQQTFAVERGGGRPGHTTRANIDLEYVLFPREYKQPGREVFAVLEITALHHTAMRTLGFKEAATGGTQLLLAPGLQYVATPRFVLEASWQLPVFADVRDLQLRTRSNLLLGVRWLF